MHISVQLSWKNPSRENINFTSSHWEVLHCLFFTFLQLKVTVLLSQSVQLVQDNLVSCWYSLAYIYIASGNQFTITCILIMTWPVEIKFVQMSCEWCLYWRLFHCRFQVGWWLMLLLLLLTGDGNWEPKKINNAHTVSVLVLPLYRNYLHFVQWFLVVQERTITPSPQQHQQIPKLQRDQQSSDIYNLKLVSLICMLKLLLWWEVWCTVWWCLW